MRVIVVANHLLSRAGLSALLESNDDIEVVEQIPLAEEFLETIDSYDADICLIDTGTFNDETIDLLNSIEALPLLILVSDAKTAIDMMKEFTRNSGYGVLLRDTDPDVFATALDTVISGLMVFDPLIIDAMMPRTPVNDSEIIDTLTEREIEVLQHLAEGFTNKQIAHELKISTNTVKFHLNAILSKLHARSRTEAVVRATRLGLIFL